MSFRWVYVCQAKSVHADQAVDRSSDGHIRIFHAKGIVDVARDCLKSIGAKDR